MRLVLRYAKHIEKCLDDLPEFPSFRGEAWEVVSVAAAVPQSRAMGQGAQAGKVPHRRSGPESAHATTAAGAVLVHADLRRRRTARRRGLFPALARLRAHHAERQGPDRSRPHVGARQALARRKTGGRLRHVRRGDRVQGHAAPHGRMHKPDDPLFIENHREGIKELLIKAELRSTPTAARGMRRASARPGFRCGLSSGPNPDYRDIAKWARTSPAMIATFYDQTHPQLSVERIVGFRKRSKPSEQKTRTAFHHDDGQPSSISSYVNAAAGTLRDPESRPGAPQDGTILRKVTGGTCRHLHSLRSWRPGAPSNSPRDRGPLSGRHKASETRAESVSRPAASQRGVVAKRRALRPTPHVLRISSRRRPRHTRHRAFDASSEFRALTKSANTVTSRAGHLVELCVT